MSGNSSEARVFYLTHPAVRIDPGVPVTQWGLTEPGRARALLAARAVWTAGIGRIVASAETKALETAAIVAAARGVAIEVRPAMHENDRSATGFLPPTEFEAVADRFFAEPRASVRGWERAIDAQARIVAEVDAVLAAPPSSGKRPDVLIVGHGAVGTLLLCHLAGRRIDRIHDQPPGGGSVLAFASVTRRMLHAWRPLEHARIGKTGDDT